MIQPASFHIFLWVMLVCAIIVFISLYFVRAGYGMLRDGKWGPQINNKLGWILMEAPVFIVMCVLCLCSPRRDDAVCLVFFGLFQLHYLNRSFILPVPAQGTQHHADRNHRHGRRIQHPERLHAGRMDLLLCPPKTTIRPRGSPLRSLSSEPSSFLPEWPSTSIRTT